MATAADLEEAAGESATLLFAAWQAGILKARVTNFGTTCLALFPDAEVNSRPCANWCALILALGATMVGTATFMELQTAITYVYRMCLMTDHLATTVPALITPAQSAAVLASYNAQF